VLAFVVDFVFGDDWRMAAGVAVALLATALLSRLTAISSWWLVPLVVAVLLALSLRRALRAAGVRDQHDEA
jgi:hypothetical protein